MAEATMKLGTDKERRYNCFWCNLTFLRRTELMNHIKNNHEEKYAETCSASETDEFRCMYCKEQYSQLSYLMSHVKKAHKEHYCEALSKPEYFKHKCLWCDHKFNKLSYLMSHIESDHPEQYTQAQNSKCMDRSKKEQILREGMKDERPASTSSSTNSSPQLQDCVQKNNNEKDATLSQVSGKTENSKRPGSCETIPEPKKFKKPRLHGLDDITKDERNPPAEPKETEPSKPPEAISKEQPTNQSLLDVASNSDLKIHKFQTPMTQFLAPKLKYDEAVGPPDHTPGHTSEAQTKLFMSHPRSSSAGSFTKLKEESGHKVERHDDISAPRPRGRPSKLATIMGFPGMGLLDLPPSVGIDPPRSTTGGGSAGQYKCFWCDQTFKMRGRLMDHIDQQHKSSKEQQDKEASASIKQKLTHADLSAPNAPNGWPPSGGPFVSPAWPHTLPIPGYFFPQFNGLDYMYGRRSAFPPPQQPTFPGPVQVSLVPQSTAMTSCKFFKLGNSRTRLTSSRIRASDILRKQSRCCRFYYLRLRDCNKVFGPNSDLVPECLNGQPQEEEQTFNVTESIDPPPDPKEFFRHPFLPDPRLHSPPWMNQGRRSSVPTILPMEVSGIKQEPSDDYASFAAFASSSRYGRRGSLPLDLRNPVKTPDHKIRRPREYPL